MNFQSAVSSLFSVWAKYHPWIIRTIDSRKYWIILILPYKLISGQTYCHFFAQLSVIFLVAQLVLSAWPVIYTRSSKSLLSRSVLSSYGCWVETVDDYWRTYAYPPHDHKNACHTRSVLPPSPNVLQANSPSALLPCRSRRAFTQNSGHLKVMSAWLIEKTQLLVKAVRRDSPPRYCATDMIAAFVANL